MTDAGIPPDRVVGTALQLLPIPDHADGFWLRLERALDVESASVLLAPELTVSGEPPRAAAADTGPALLLEPDPAAALVPASLRRTSNALLVALAAAAVVVVVLAGGSLLDARTGSKQLAANDPAQPSAALDDLVDGAQADSASLVTMSADGEAAASAAVLAWVDDLRSGHSENAWLALGAGSQAHFGSPAAFAQQLGSLAAGYGTWAKADPDQVLVTPLLTNEQGTIAVVTLVSTVTVDGQPKHRADAFPVRVVDGVAHVELFALAGAMEVVVPAAAPTDGTVRSLGLDEELVIVVPSDARPPVLRLDDAPPVVCGEADGTELTDLVDAPGQRCSYLPVDGFNPGEHTLTMAFVGPGGSSISAESLLFDAA